MRLHNGGTREQNHIPAGLHFRQEGTQCFSQHALGPVALHGRAHRTAGSDAKVRVQAVVGQRNKHDKRVGIGFTGAPHPLEIGGPG